jgi:hypothetical protein
MPFPLAWKGGEYRGQKRPRKDDQFGFYLLIGLRKKDGYYEMGF